MQIIKYPLESHCIDSPSVVTRERQAKFIEDRCFEFPEAHNQWPVPSEFLVSENNHNNMNLKWGFHISRSFNRTSIVQNGLRPGEYNSCIYFYTTPVLNFMKYCGDIMTKGKSHDLWLFDISQARLAADERITHNVHSHTDGLCVYTPVAVKTRDFAACKPIRMVEIPKDIINLHAMY